MDHINSAGSEYSRRFCSHVSFLSSVYCQGVIHMQMQERPAAMARIRGGSERNLQGTVRFFQRRGSVLVVAEISGLPRTDSFFGFHIHEGRSCMGEDFSSTGNHYNPTKMPHPDHAGDLPPLLGCSGRAYMAVETDRFAIRDIIGRTVVIHADPDDFTTQPSGKSGKKIGCGVICAL